MIEHLTDESRQRIVRDAIAQWRDGLVNLSRSNRLLNFRARRTSAVEIVDSDPSKLLSALSRGQEFAFRGPVVDLDKASAAGPAEPTPQAGQRGGRFGVLRTATGGSDLSGALRNLFRRAQQEYLDRGLHILYLAVGRLEWVDETGASYTSPLLLVPVELVGNGPRQLPHLRAAEDDSVINPALTLKLGESGIALPALKDLDDVDPVRVLEQVRAAVGRRRGWQVEDATVLSYFTFAKEAMYRDLLDNEDRVAEHAGIQALAASGRGEGVGDFGFDELPDTEIDRSAPAHATPLVLDADSSQRACIAAAVEGRSFVMDGPPGTGKSQTIANMIGALLHAGRTVLFVSEKAAALDVVRDRLTDVGLGAFLLELHSSKATRKEVAAELGRALDAKPVAPGGMNAIDVEQCRRRQRELNRYAAAMNDPRAPLGESLHTVIGWVSTMGEVPSAPATGRAVDGLTPSLLGEIRRLARELSEAWRPALQGTSYVWREVRESRAMASRLHGALRALDDLEGLLGASRTVAAEFGLDPFAQAESLATLLEHHAARPSEVPERWLTAARMDEVDLSLERLRGQVEDLRRRQDEATAAAGVTWSELSGADHVDALDLGRLDGLAWAPLPVDGLTVPAMDVVLSRLSADRGHLRTTGDALDAIAAMVRLPTPQTFDDADRLLFAASTATEPGRPEATWFSARGHAAALAALTHLGSVRRSLDEAEAAGRVYYDDSALNADAVTLEEQFRTSHTGLGRLTGRYRKDKATVAGFTRDGVPAAEARKHLALVVAWQQAAAAFRSAAADHTRDLGSFYDGRSTDVQRATRVVARVGQVIQRFPGVDLRALADQVGRHTTPAPALLHATGAAAVALREWRDALGQVVDVGPPPQLQAGTIAAALHWTDTHRTVLSASRQAVADLVEATGRRSTTVGEARRLLGLRLAVDRAAASLDAGAADHRTVCGALFQGEHTDLDALHGAAAWSRTLRGWTGGALTVSQLASLDENGDAGALRPGLARWRAARADVIDAFGPARRAELAEDLDDADDARGLLTALLDDSSGQDEWTAYRESLDGLVGHRLGDAVAFCAREQLAAAEVPAVVEKALLTEWIDHHLATDTALRTVRAQSRDAAVAEFRDLDRRLVSGAVGTIIDACNGRRPRMMTGQAAVIRREAEKKRKHMPVRELVQRSRDITQVIKPCFMMSPLAVSQYLSPDLGFDVVIFDEASQVAPMDAINCIYRGRALITAGDQKQLPPTSFFAVASDDGDEWVDEADDAKDFESILDLAKSSGAYRSLTLRWHYRSRHESLIAFSNTSFYDGRLITFPGAEHEGPDVGVELIPVDGIYRRGSSRDNPVEAQKGGAARPAPLRHQAESVGRCGDLLRGAGDDDRERGGGGAAGAPRSRRALHRRPPRRVLRQESRVGAGRRTRRDDLLHRLRPGREPEDDDELRAVEPRRRVAAAQRRGDPGPLPQRDRQFAARRGHHRLDGERGGPAPPPLPRLRRARATRARPRHQHRR